MLSILDRIGDWNPQLLRELKGHLKSRHILIAIATSLIGQFLWVQYFLGQLPYKGSTSEVYNRYCTNRQYYPNTPCLRDAAGNFIIHWSEWWHDLFIGLGGIAIFALLVAGTFMLINDL
ncbi:MAG: ABC transporter permease, partial [Coleofasciculaceae cyanobacterium]